MMHTISIELVILNRNKLTSWSDINCPDMYYLDLSHNQITTISVDAFNSMPSLSQLDLANNFITDIPTFQGMDGLVSLNLMLNKIKHVNSESFRNLVNLQYLFLYHNEIESFNFTGDVNLLPNLVELTMSSNQLTSINGLVLPVNVSSVDFRFNKLTHLETGSIKPISQLRSLNIENNEIRKIDRDFFNDAVNLTVRMESNLCYSYVFTIIDKDDLGQLNATLKNCYMYNHAMKSISSIIVLVVSVSVSVFVSFHDF